MRTKAPARTQPKPLHPLASPESAKATLTKLPAPRARSVALASPAPKPQPRTREAVQLPPILLEGDAPIAPRVSGPGERFALRPSPPEAPAPAIVIKDKLPEAYGTQRLFLTARDPHWLYASWDLTAEQRVSYASLARDGQLVLRCHTNDLGGQPISETRLPPDTKSWFIHAGRAATRYVVELGYYNRQDQWVPVSTSAATFTPPDSLAEVHGGEFATIPPDVTLKKVFEVIEEAVVETPPLVSAVPEFHFDDHAAARATVEEQQPTRPAPATSSKQNGRPVRSRPQPAPGPKPAPAPAWSSAQRQALAELVRVDSSRRVWMGSLEITELIRRHLAQEISSAAPPQAEGPGAQPQQPGALELGAAGVSSPVTQEAAAPAKGGFWFNVNAELVVYGATESDAKVAIGGRKVRLRPDGTFSFRFALPDGSYPLAIAAQSADGVHALATHLQFSRKTEHRGPVGAHAQDASLKTPANPDLG